MDAGSGTNKAVAGINVTPMIDVLLVLLIIFLVIQPMSPSGLKSVIPQPSKAEAPTPPETVVVEVVQSGGKGAGGVVYRINQRAFLRSQIVDELRTIFAARGDRTMFVKGDAALTFADVAQVVDMGHQAGVEQIGLMTQRVEAGR